MLSMKVHATGVCACASSDTLQVQTGAAQAAGHGSYQRGPCTNSAVLWDVGRYSILEMKKDSESDDDEESDE